VLFARSACVLFLLFLTRLGAVDGCNASPSCVVAPVITVSDAKSGQLLCGATVLALATGDAADGDGGAIAFAPSGGASDCAYGASLPDPGPFTISVSAPGYQALSLSNVRGILDPCDNPPSPPVIHIAIQPD